MRKNEQNCTIRDYIYLINILYLTNKINENEKNKKTIKASKEKNN